MSLPAFIFSLSLLLAALSLAVTSALALAKVFRFLGTWVRWPVAIFSKAVALMPLVAWIWAFIGVWAGVYGWPIGSLMLTSIDSAQAGFLLACARAIWWWVPPLFLLSLPVTFELLASLLVGKRGLLCQVRFVGLLGIAWLPVVEDAFHLPGALAPLIPALHAGGSSQLSPIVFQAGLLAVAWCCLIALWPQSPLPYCPAVNDRIREGALAIGQSPGETWRRHILPRQLRQGMAHLCSAFAFGICWWTAFGCPWNADRSREFYAGLGAALGTPLAPMQIALPSALCALSFWLLGRIIQRRLH